MIDIHCHLLPGIDDGPALLEQSLELAHALTLDGVQLAVCTPHVFPGLHDNRRSSIEIEHRKLEAQLRVHGIDLQLAWAGEVRLTPEIIELQQLDELPFLGQSDGYHNMLLEMPDGQVPLGADKLVSHLFRCGIRPVLVHPERNRGVMENPDRLRPFVRMGCAVQLTAGSLLGDFGSRAQAAAQHMLDADWVTAVASDAHNMKGRSPRMLPARAWLTKHHGAALAEQLTLEGPAWLCGLSD